MKTFLIIGISLYIIIYGLCVIIKSWKSITELNSLIKRCEARTKGKIIDVVEGRIIYSSKSGRQKQQYHKVYEYQAGMQVRREVSKHEYDGGVNNIWVKSIRETIGQEEEMCFNPNNPEEFYIYKEIDNDLLLRKMTILFSIVAIILSTSLLLTFQIYIV